MTTNEYTRGFIAGVAWRALCEWLDRAQLYRKRGMKGLALRAKATGLVVWDRYMDIAEDYR